MGVLGPISERRRVSTGLLGFVIAALLLAATGCGNGTDPGDTGAGAAPSAAGESSTVDALSFTAPTLTGATLDAARLSGSPVVLWFWAPWCTICRAEAPDVAAVAADYEGTVTFVGVPGLGQADDMRAFVDDTGTEGFEHAIDSDGSLWQRFGIVSQPAFAFVSADGAVRTFAGSLGADELRRATEELAAG